MRRFRNPRALFTLGGLPSTSSTTAARLYRYRGEICIGLRNCFRTADCLARFGLGEEEEGPPTWEEGNSLFFFLPLSRTRSLTQPVFALICKQPWNRLRIPAYPRRSKYVRRITNQWRIDVSMYRCERFKAKVTCK